MNRRFNQTTYTVTCKSAIRYIWKGPKGNVACRTRSSLVLPLSGRIFYAFEGNAFEVKRGDLLYLPKSSAYTYHLLDNNCEVMQIEFDFSEQYEDGNFSFRFTDNVSKKPVNTEEYIIKFHRVIIGYESHSPVHRLGALSEICDMLSLFASQTTEQKSLVDVGIAYIEEHKFENFHIDDVANECGLSPTHFRRLFKEKTGVSPIKYKNHLVIQKAKDLLQNTSMNIGEIAIALGFYDIYSFSRFFKTYTSVSPEAFRKNN